MRVKILGENWKWVYRPIGFNGKGPRKIGLCDGEKRIISILKSLEGKERLDTEIHEALHAAGWHIDEEFVSQFGQDLSTILYDQLGYRIQE